MRGILLLAGLAQAILWVLVIRYVRTYLAQRAELVEEGLPESVVRRVRTMLDRNEYKRRQAPIGIRITPRGFGKDWRYPITSGYRPGH